MPPPASRREELCPARLNGRCGGWPRALRLAASRAEAGLASSACPRAQAGVALAVVSVTCSNFLCAGASGAAGGAVPIAVTAEQMAIVESVARWAKRAGPIAAVRGLETSGGRTGAAAGPAMARGQEATAGADLAGLAELGIFAIGIPAETGGGGGTTPPFAVRVEQIAAPPAPAPP